MEMRNHGPEFHVLQQSRRDKLRNQNSSTSSQHLGDYRANLEHLSSNHGLNVDLVQLPGWRYGNISCDTSSVLSSEMLNFASNSHSVVLNKDDVIANQASTSTAPRFDKLVETGDASFTSLARPVKVSGDPQNCSTWKSVDSRKIGSGWSIANYSSGSAGIDGNLSPMFVRETLSGSLKLNSNVPVSGIDGKTSYFGYHEVQPSLTNPSCETSGQYSENHCGDVQVGSSSRYQNTLQEVVTSTAVGTQGLEMASMALQNTRETERSTWVAGEDESHLLPTYVDRSNQLFVNNSASDMVNSPVEGCRQWNGELGRDSRATENDTSNTQALSLSLSSVSPPKTYLGQIRERISNMPDLKPLKSEYLCSYSNHGSKALGNAACQDMVGNLTFTHRDVVPLGPFTGYAIILKSSRFLMPAQQLLGEFCNFAGDKDLNISEVSGNILDEVALSGEAVNATPCNGGSMAVDSGASSSTFYSSNGKSHEVRGVSSSNESYPRPEYLQIKVKLLYMQDEVCRRYRQYHQQMQMVVSSFESVAGLSAATPYISLALKAVSRQFRCFKNAISDQLRNIRKALGEDMLSPTGTSSKRDAGTSSLKFIDQTLQNQNANGERLHYLEPQTHVWRPQRGLPERAVAILRAWLFDHFLHPYPTDTDKHMLATQTGLTRNQVSNWFINARVRVWKPMVEEIHMLETKVMAEKGSNVGKANAELATPSASQRNEGLHLSRLSLPNESQFLIRPPNMRGIPDMPEECPGICQSASVIGEKSYPDIWNQDKRSRIDCGLPVGMDRPLMGFMPYQRNSLEIGGLGAVSLTLGLRQSIEGAQQQQQMQQHEGQLSQRFGGQIIHDFTG